MKMQQNRQDNEQEKRHNLGRLKSLVNNKENEIKKILKFCDLEWDDKCLNPEKNSKTPIKTVSVSQARQPIYKTSLNSNINFDKYLEEMFSILK